MIGWSGKSSLSLCEVLRVSDQIQNRNGIGDPRRRNSHIECHPDPRRLYPLRDPRPRFPRRSRYLVLGGEGGESMGKPLW